MAFLDLYNSMFAYHVAFAKMLVFHGYGIFAVLTRKILTKTYVTLRVTIL